MRTIAAQPGEHISDSAKRALRLIGATLEPVSFMFNDVEVIVGIGDTVETITAQFPAKLAAATKAWRESPAGRKSARDAARRLAKAQRDTDRLLKTLPWALRHMDRLVPWCARFSEAADHIGVRGVDYSALLKQFEAHGYVTGAMVGMKPEDIKRQRIYMALYLVGQAMSCFKSNMPPHPIIQKFAAEYAAMPKGGPVMRWSSKQ